MSARFSYTGVAKLSLATCFFAGLAIADGHLDFLRDQLRQREPAGGIQRACMDVSGLSNQVADIRRGVYSRSPDLLEVALTQLSNDADRASQELIGVADSDFGQVFLANAEFEELSPVFGGITDPSSLLIAMSEQLVTIAVMSIQISQSEIPIEDVGIVLGIVSAVGEACDALDGLRLLPQEF